MLSKLASQSWKVMRKRSLQLHMSKIAEKGNVVTETPSQLALATLYRNQTLQFSACRWACPKLDKGVLASAKAIEEMNWKR